MQIKLFCGIFQSILLFHKKIDNNNNNNKITPGRGHGGGLCFEHDKQ